MLRADGAVYRACLQFAVLRWAIDALGLSLSEAASLPATVALGVVAVAGTAGRCVTLAQAHRLQPVCLVLNLSFNAATFSDSRSAVLPTLVPVLIGAIGGLLMVSMNALLRHPGQLMATAGRSIAMQNLTKNVRFLMMLVTYAGLLWLGVAIALLMVLARRAANSVGLLIWRARGVQLPEPALPARTRSGLPPRAASRRRAGLAFGDDFG